MQKVFGTGLRSWLIVISIALALSSCAGASSKVATPKIPVPTESEVYKNAPGCEGPIIDFSLSIPEIPPCDEACLEGIGNAGEKAIKCVQDDSAYWESLYMVLRAKVEAVNDR